MRRLALWFTACILLACGGKQADTPSAPPDEAAVGEAGADATPSDDGAEGPEKCDFRVKDECYSDQNAACAAAGCEPDNCVVMESYPAQIACE